MVALATVTDTDNALALVCARAILVGHREIDIVDWKMSVRAAKAQDAPNRSWAMASAMKLVWNVLAI